MLRAPVLLRPFLTSLLASFLFVVLQGQALAHPLLVDDFSQAVSILSLDSPPNAGTIAAGVDAGIDVLGDRRTTMVGTTAQAIPGFDSATVTYYTGGPGFMDVESQVGWEGKVSLSYDLAELPSVLEGTNGLEIEFLGYDGPGRNPMAVTVYLDAPGGGPGTDGPTAFLAPSAQTLQVLFPDGVSLDDVATLRVSFTVPAGGDFRIDSIYTVVPEPGTLALLASGLLGLGLGRTRNKRQRIPRTAAICRR